MIRNVLNIIIAGVVFSVIMTMLNLAVLSGLIYSVGLLK